MDYLDPRAQNDYEDDYEEEPEFFDFDFDFSDSQEDTSGDDSPCELYTTFVTLEDLCAIGKSLRESELSVVRKEKVDRVLQAALTTFRVLPDEIGNQNALARFIDLVRGLNRVGDYRRRLQMLHSETEKIAQRARANDIYFGPELSRAIEDALKY